MTPFTFDPAHGDQAYLSEADGLGNLTGYRAAVSFDAGENRISFGRYTNSVGSISFVATRAPSFGVEAPASVAQFRTGTGAANAAPRLGPVVINELMFFPPLLGGIEDDTQHEFVELRSVTNTPVQLFDPNATTNTWRLSGGVDFTFPPDVTIPGGGFLLVVNFDPVGDPLALAEFRTRYNVDPAVRIFRRYNGKLANTGERIALYKPGPPEVGPQAEAGFVPYVLVEAVNYIDSAPWPAGANGTGASLQRNGRSRR